MAVKPRKAKNTVKNRSVQERSEQVLMTRKEAARWDKARKDAEKAAVAKVTAETDGKWMEALQRVLTTGKLTKEDKLAAEAVAPQLFTLTTGDGEDPGFRRITSIATLRDLNPLMHDRMLQVCYFLRVTTPFGKRIVEILSEYTLGKGIRVTAVDPNVQDVIDDFWKDDVNQMDENLEQWDEELTTFGELCVPVAVNPISGKVRAGYIDPMNIDTIQFAEMATSDGTASINIPFGVRLRREVGDVLQEPMTIIRRVEDPNDASYGELDGECWYWAINKAKSASRGFSELFSLADWIDLFDQMIFDFGDKVRFLNAFIWHYVIEGADEKKVDEFKNKFTKDPPKQGGVLFTNERVKPQAITPDFKGADMAAGATMVKKYGLGGAGIPMVLTGDGDDANRAASLEMNAPFVKKIQRRQNKLSRMLTNVLDFVLSCAVRAGVLRKGTNLDYTIEFPEVAVKDLQKGALVLQGVTTSLVTGQQQGWITDKTCARAFHMMLGEIGIDVGDSAEEYEAAQQEKQDRAAKQQEQFAPQSALNKALKRLNAPNGDEAGTGADDELADEGEEIDEDE